MKDDAATKGDVPAGTDDKDQAGASPSPKRGDRNMKYFAESGTQKTHPAKPSQSNVMRHGAGT